MPLLHQIFKNEPGWGGVCIDDKGLYWETLSEMARHFNREKDLILLRSNRIAAARISADGGTRREPFRRSIAVVCRKRH